MNALFYCLSGTLNWFCTLLEVYKPRRTQYGHFCYEQHSNLCFWCRINIPFIFIKKTESHPEHNKLQTVSNASVLIKSYSKNFINKRRNNTKQRPLSGGTPPFERNSCTARRPGFEVTVPKRTCHFYTQTHMYRPLPCLLTLIPPSLCVSYELSEKTQWIEWQGSKARPSNRPAWGETDDCVHESLTFTEGTLSLRGWIWISLHIPSSMLTYQKALCIIFY